MAIMTEHWKDVLVRQGVDCNLILPEWDLLKHQLYNNEKIYSITWPQINAKYRLRTSNVLDLIDLVLSLPAGSAECERGFSIMKLTKTDYRNRLSSATLTDIMRIKLQSPNISEFDPIPAIHLWNSSTQRHRRPTFQASRNSLLTDSLAVNVSTSTQEQETVQKEADAANAVATECADQDSDVESV
ncbi:uncharacterized protein [Ptychodera flava]|uniref:uncharacterized protein n=1 Tax=Ptychodera flava TaxID=63121 RepID=UPI003969E42C